MLGNLKVNSDVLNADIHALFQFFNIAFFNGSLQVVILEWSTRMTLCAGICYYQVNIYKIIIFVGWTLHYKAEQVTAKVQVRERAVRDTDT